MTLVRVRLRPRSANIVLPLNVSHLHFADVAAQSTCILSSDGAHAAYTRTMLPSTATLQTGHEEHFREHSTQHNMWPQFAKIVLVGRSQHIAHCFPTFSSSLSPGSIFVTTRLCAFGGGSGGGSYSLPLESSAVTWTTSMYCWKSASVPVGDGNCETQT